MVYNTPNGDQWALKETAFLKARALAGLGWVGLEGCYNGQAFGPVAEFEVAPTDVTPVVEA
jgi:hypothetical protein